jgi:hypothetical protein
MDSIPIIWNWNLKVTGGTWLVETVEVGITIRNLSNVNDSEHPFVWGVCLRKPFQLPLWIFEHAKSISHVSLEFFEEGNIAPDISFLEKFPKLVSLWFLGAKFNANMLKTIFKCRLLRHLFLHNCKMGNCLSIIAKIRCIEKFQSSECFHTWKEMMAPSQCRELKLDSIYGP